MKRPRKQNNRAAIIATFLLLIAIPISVLGTQKINDIRNRAAEEEPNLYFITDFTKDEIANAYIEIPYEHNIVLGGDNTENAIISLGCDITSCGEKCPEQILPPPTGLLLRSTTNTLLWPDPQNPDTPHTWDITISARIQKDDESYDCAVETFPLTLSPKKENDPPQCKILFTRKRLDKIPQSYKTDFILLGTDLDDGIANATFSVTKDNTEEHIQSWSFDDINNVVINKDSPPPLSFILDETGPYSIKAEMIDSKGERSECVEEEKKEIFIVIPGDNGSPEFKSNPYEDSTPGTSLTTGAQYSYQVEAEDPNDDDIDYFIINETGWLNFTVNKNENGEFEGTFSGTPTQPGSYTVVIALNDGYHDHYSTQIWVINVDSPTNDTPVVKIVQPETGRSVGQNEEMLIQWEATDNNLIERFDVFLTTDPTNESTLQIIETNIGYNYDSYIWNTGPTAPGRYYILVRATDNQSPPATGQGISPIFTITSGTTPIPPDEETLDEDDSDIPENYPQIKNLRPSDKSKIKNTKPLISADIFASNDNTIKKESVEIKIDNNDITETSEIRGEGKKEGSVLHTPEEPLTEGSHKITVSFKDSSDKIARKTWTFTVETEKPDEPDDSDEDIISIFGFKIPKRIALIFGVGLLLLILAVTIPWLFYAAWRRSSEETDDTDLYIPPAYPARTKEPDPPTPQMPSTPIRLTSIEPTIIEPKPQDDTETPEAATPETPTPEAPTPEAPEIYTAKIEPTLTEPKPPKDLEPKTEISIETEPTPTIPAEKREPIEKPDVEEPSKKPDESPDEPSDKPYKPVSDKDVISAFQATSPSPDTTPSPTPSSKDATSEPKPIKPDLSPASLKPSDSLPPEPAASTLPPTVPPIAP